MPDADDFPRCSTCDYYVADHYEETIGTCTQRIGDQRLRGKGGYTIVSEDFGCVLHSSLQSEDES